MILHGTCPKNQGTHLKYHGSTMIYVQNTMVVPQFNCKDHGSTMVHIQNTMVVPQFNCKDHGSTMVHIQNTMVVAWIMSKIPQYYYGTCPK